MTALDDAAADYLAFRRAFGHKLTSHERLLSDFVTYLNQHGADTVTTNMAITWAGAPPTLSPRRVADRLSVTRKFAQYLVAFDPATEVPPAHLLHVGATRPTPYIFSAEEVRALMSAARRLAPPLFAASFTTLIGLMNSTGLRTMEVTRLDRTDLTCEALDGGRLLVRRTHPPLRQVRQDPSAAAAPLNHGGVARVRRLSRSAGAGPGRTGVVPRPEWPATGFSRCHVHPAAA